VVAKRLRLPTKDCRFRQLCAIARELLEADPTIRTKGEDWKYAVIDRVIALGYRDPAPRVYGALTAVEHAYLKTHPPPEPLTKKQLKAIENGLERASPTWNRRPQSWPDESDSPILEHPLRTDPMTPLRAAMPPWLRALKKRGRNSRE
jgi:hypothetical protein